MPSPDYIPPNQPMPDWLKEIFIKQPPKDPLAPFKIPQPEKEKEPC